MCLAACVRKRCQVRSRDTRGQKDRNGTTASLRSLIPVTQCALASVVKHGLATHRDKKIETAPRHPLLQRHDNLRMYQTEPPPLSKSTSCFKIQYICVTTTICTCTKQKTPHCQNPSRASKSNASASLNSGGVLFPFIDPSGFGLL